MLDGKIERTFQSRTPINESINCPEKNLKRSLASAFSAAASSTRAKLSIAELQRARFQQLRSGLWPRRSEVRFGVAASAEPREGIAEVGQQDRRISAKRRGQAGGRIVRRLRSTSHSRVRQANELKALRRRSGFDLKLLKSLQLLFDSGFVSSGALADPCPLLDQ